MNYNKKFFIINVIIILNRSQISTIINSREKNYIIIILEENAIINIVKRIDF